MSNADTVGVTVRPKKLSLHERAQLALAEKRKNVPAAPRQQVIHRREDSSAPAPLSFAQQRMLFLDQLEPGSTAYNMPAARRLTGPLDVAALERAFGELVRRHEVLRTTFAEADGLPAQVVAPFEPRPLPLVDLSGLAGDERESEVQRLADDERRRPFDLARGPLLRVSLLRLADEDHVLLITMHHIISDGWSVGVLVRELTTLYVAYAKGEESPLEELPVQYADYSAWQRDYLTGEVLERQLSYWKEQLAGVPAMLALPTDRPRPAVQSYRGAEVSFMLPAELAADLRRLGQAHGCTLFMTLLAGWQALLSRYAGQDDVVVGTPIAGRTLRETENLIGLFVNTLALRTSFSGDPTFAELLGRVREVTLGAYAHQEVPFERLVEELQPERSLSHPPLFQTMFILQNATRERMALGEVAVAAFAGDGAETEKFDLTLGLAEGAARVDGALSYSTALFDHATAERMVAHYVRLLSAAAADAGQRVGDITLLSAEEERRIVVEWNETAREYPRLSLGELFEAQVARTPEAVALVCGGESATYAELNARANRIARRLRELGVGPESRVAVMMERSVELVVALFGVLKAGAAYVPLDPEYPRERLRFMLDDSAAGVLLTQRGLREVLPETAARVVCVDEDGEVARLAALGGLNLPCAAAPDNLAYVIYTSGSTGTPKGVSITHLSLSNFIEAMRRAPGLSADDTLLALTSVCFDIAVLELFLPLCAGARVVMATRRDASSDEALRHLLASSRVTLMQATPATYSMLLDGGAAMPGAPLRKVLCGGEAMSAALGRQLQGGGGEVWNLYGPTETTVWSARQRVTAAAASGRGGVVSLGRPVENTQLYVLDAKLRPVPVGVCGELYIGGDGLARGYLNRPGLTAEKFVPDPFSPRRGARMYRTGDLAHYLSDGELAYLGRGDNQVKLRGFRIELGEVEAALGQCEGVKQAAVSLREDSDGEKRMVAFVVAEAAQEVSGNQLRAALSQRLPQHMMPAAFVMLEAMPLTPNGKIDRKALPAPERAAGVAEYVAPRTEAEAALARIWAEVLKVERVGVDDNFFELGGHSLLATKLISRVRERFDRDFPLRAVFESPTVAEMAEALSALGEKEGAGEGETPIRRVSREGTLQLSFMQEHVWSLAKPTPGTNGPRKSRNMEATFRLKGPLKLDVLERALAELGRRHEILRTTYAEVGGNLVPLIAPTLSGVLSVVDLQSLPATGREQEAWRLVADCVRRPFDLAGDVLIRATLFRLAPQDHVLVFVIDHFIFDGWSEDVFMNELAAIYPAFYHDRPSPLPELEIQFIDWAAWQRGRFSGEAAEKFIDFWRQRLDASHPFPRLELPQVLPPPAVVTRRRQTHWKLLPYTVREKLEALGRDKQATMFMVQLAVLDVVLHAYTGKERIGVITNAANRARPETQRLFGWISTQLILPADLSGNPSFSRLLECVRAMCKSAFEHADLPLPHLMALLNDDDDPVAPPYVLLSVQSDWRADGQRLVDKMRQAGLTINTVPPEPPEHVPGTGLWVNVHDVEEGIQISIDSGVDQYLPETITEVLELYCRVVESVIADPEQTLSELTALLRKEDEVAV